MSDASRSAEILRERARVRRKAAEQVAQRKQADMTALGERDCPLMRKSIELDQALMLVLHHQARELEETAGKK